MFSKASPDPQRKVCSMGKILNLDQMLTVIYQRLEPKTHLKLGHLSPNKILKNFLINS